MTTTLFTKRELLAAGGFGLVAVAGAAVLRPERTRPGAGSLGATAFPADPLDHDRDDDLPQGSDLRAGLNDLTRIAPDAPPASGVPVLISGRLTNGFGRPLPATRVELWNANHWGRYTHIQDLSDLPDDPNFAGSGRTRTDSQGRYRFLTVMPGSYPAERGGERLRPAHVHLAIRSGPARLVTQLYFDGDPHLAKDPMFARLAHDQWRHLGQPYAPTIAAAERGFRFDIVTDGPQATFFE